MDSVNEMMKYPSGRAKLAEMRKVYWKECLQPSDPLFNKVYGEQNEEIERKKRKNIKIAQEMREEMEEKKRWKKTLHKGGVPGSKYFI